MLEKYAEELVEKLLKIQTKGVAEPANTDGQRMAMYARGEYEPGTRYERGDVVTISQLGIFVALSSTISDPRTNSPEWSVVAVTVPGGVSSAAAAGNFLSLVDTPASYFGSAGMGVRVNAGATGLEFAPVSPAVPVQSVPPVLPADGDLWFFDTAGQLMIYDASSSAWIGV